jgi:hypothetical protein
MTVNISRITTATSVALQASENTAVSETNIDDTLLTENVQTAAGQQTLSRQAIDRGTGVDGRRHGRPVPPLRHHPGQHADPPGHHRPEGCRDDADVHRRVADIAEDLRPDGRRGLDGGGHAARLGAAGRRVMHSRRWYSLLSRSARTGR